MTVLLTGGAGFIGSYTAKMFLDKGYRVVIVDDLSTGLHTNVPESAVFYHRSMNENLSDIFEKERPRWVVHMAAQVSVSQSFQDPKRDTYINILGGINVLEEAKSWGVEKIVFSSTAAVYGDPQKIPLDEDHPKAPMSPYGINKLSFEHYLESYYQNYGLDYTVLRYANVYGPGQQPGADGGVVAVFMDQIKRGLPLEIHGDGNQTRDFIYVEDAAVANLLALKSGSRCVINIGFGNETSIKQLFDLIERLINKEIFYEYKQKRPGDISRSVFCTERAYKVLGFSAKHSLEQGLCKTIETEGVLL